MRAEGPQIFCESVSDVGPTTERPNERKKFSGKYLVRKVLDIAISISDSALGGVNLGYTQKKERKVYSTSSTMDNEEKKKYLTQIKRLSIVSEGYVFKPRLARKIF